MLDKSTLAYIYRPLMDVEPIDTGDRCAVCGRYGRTERHHIVWRSWGELYRDGRKLPKPTITLCGFGNTSGCHGLAHQRMLHFRKGESGLEYLRTDEPTRYERALDMDGWREVVLPPRGSKEAPQRPNTAPRQQSATSYQPQPQQPVNAPSAPQINQAPISEFMDESPIRTGVNEKEEHMALPKITDEQRRANLVRAKRSRHERAALKASLKEGLIGVADVLADTRQCAQGMRVYDLLRSLPGYGKAKAGELMELLHIAESRRGRGLGARQREALLDALGR